MENTNGQVERRGLMFVLSSPSGAGKTTISRSLLERDDNISLSVSVTTRPKRPGEIDGKDYFFVDPTEFNLMLNRQELLEHAKVFDHYYGTPKQAVQDALSAGRDVLFDIDWQGEQQLKQAAGNDLASVFILPPSTEELARRLQQRAQDPAEVVAARMARGSVSRHAKILVTRKPPKPSARARRSQRSTVGSFCTSVAVEGLSITNSARGASGFQTRVSR